jgi:CheY-like chemotaxis protein
MSNDKQTASKIGRPADGFVHEFNNVLGSVMGFANLLIQDLPENSPQRGFAEKILSASQRGKELVAQHLAIAQAGEAARDDSGSATESLRGRERVLIVDDESVIADGLSIGLARLGYESVGVCDPREALAAFAEDPAAWDVVVTDQVMPPMRGVELLRRMKALRPDIRAILCSGHDDDFDRAAVDSADIYMRKPVDALEIAKHIRSLANRDQILA